MQQFQYDPMLDTTNHLVFRGMQNLRLNAEAQQALGQRGISSPLLRDFAEYMKQRNGSQEYKAHSPERKRRTWLAPVTVRKCCDCGENTARTYNNGRVFQCSQCAEGVKLNSRERWHELIRTTRVKNKMA